MKKNKKNMLMSLVIAGGFLALNLHSRDILACYQDSNGNYWGDDCTQGVQGGSGPGDSTTVSSGSSSIGTAIAGFVQGWAAAPTVSLLYSNITQAIAPIMDSIFSSIPSYTVPAAFAGTTMVVGAASSALVGGYVAAGTSYANNLYTNTAQNVASTICAVNPGFNGCP